MQPDNITNTFNINRHYKTTAGEARKENVEMVGLILNPKTLEMGVYFNMDFFRSLSKTPVSTDSKGNTFGPVQFLEEIAKNMEHTTNIVKALAKDDGLAKFIEAHDAK